MFIKIQAISYLIFFVFTLNALSDAELRLNDSTLSRGIEHHIDLMGTLPDGYGELSLKIRYNALLIDIKNVYGGPEFGILDEDVEYVNNMSDLENSILLVRSSNFNSVTDDKICTIVLEALAGPDSIAVLEPFGLTIDGIEPENTEYFAGTYRIGSPIFEKYEENMSYLRPNPFNETVTIPFTLSKETNVEFRIFNLSGMMIDKLPGSTRSEYLLVDHNGNPIGKSLEDKLPQGSYFLSYTPNRWETAQGAYYIVMKGSQGTYLKTMIYVR